MSYVGSKPGVTVPPATGMVKSTGIQLDVAIGGTDYISPDGIETMTNKTMIIGGDGLNEFKYIAKPTVERMLEDKLVEITSAKDFGAVGDGTTDDTTAVNDAVTAIADLDGGEIVFTEGTYNYTTPTNLLNVTLHHESRQRANLFAESGETEWYAKQQYKYGDAGAHTSHTELGLHIEHRPVGSGDFGPTKADMAFSVSSIKKNWLTTTTTGEVDGIYCVVRNGGGIKADSAGYMADVSGSGNSGFVAAMENQTTNVNSSATVLKNIRTQLGVVNARDNQYLGYFAQVQVGDLTGASLGGAFVASEQSTAKWKSAFQYFNAAGQPLFDISRGSTDGEGRLTMFNPVSSSYKTMRVSNSGTFSMLNSAGTNEIFGVTDSGTMTARNLNQPLTSYSCTISSELGSFGSAAVNQAQYVRVGSHVFFDIYYTITTVGTASGSLKLTLPSNVSSYGCHMNNGKAGNGKTINGNISGGGTNILYFSLYDATTPCTITGMGHVSGFYVEA